MKLKHSDIDYIGQILDNVLYDMLDHPDYHKLSKGIVDDFRYVLTEANGQSRFEKFTEDEVYILFRQAMEASAEIVMLWSYNNQEIKIHNDLLNEMIDELKRREK